ncbi:hypothetical protein [Lysobacter gummosus]
MTLANAGIGAAGLAASAWGLVNIPVASAMDETTAVADEAAQL